MQPSEIRREDVEAWARRQNPDATNPGTGCYYVYPHEINSDGMWVASKRSELGHCIAGQFFIDHGIHPDLLVQYEGDYANHVATRLGFTEEVGETLRTMQKIADIPLPWGVAIKNAFPQVEFSTQ